MENPAVTRFRSFLRIKTVQPQPDYAGCVVFLKGQAAEMGLPCQVIESAPSKPTVVISWIGTNPNLSAIMCNCHTDVVPVFEESWSHPPFDAVKLDNGDIIARGSQDMKCVGSSYLEAIRNLMAKGIRLERTVHVMFTPDEEIGGSEGMVALVGDHRFKELNIGFALDEGLANPGDAFKVYYGERAPWWVKITAHGNVGHGSQFIEDTAASRLHQLTSRLLDFRKSEELRFKLGSKPDGTPLTLGDVTTINWTMSSGGVQYNVVPQTLEAGFDIRVSPSTHLIRFRKQLADWCKELNCFIEYVNDSPSNPVTPIVDNPWLEAIKKASVEFGVPLEIEIFPAATDSRFLRLAGIPAIGVSPINHTKVLLHDHNEYLNEGVYLEGIRWYEVVFQHLGRVSNDLESKMPKIILH